MIIEELDSELICLMRNAELIDHVHNWRIIKLSAW